MFCGNIGLLTQRKFVSVAKDQSSAKSPENLNEEASFAHIANLYTYNSNKF